MKPIWRATLSPAGLFSIIALVFGAYFVFAIPPLWGVDEYTHFDRAFQLSKGVLFAHKVNIEGYGGSLPDNLIELNQKIHLDLADNHPTPDVFHRKDVDDAHSYDKLTHAKLSRHYRDFPFNGGAAYSPVAYAPAIVGILAGRALHVSLGHLITLARLCTLLFYIVVVAFAIAVLPNRGAKWLLFVVALLPMSLFQASIVNADGVTLAASFLLFATAVAILSRPKAPGWQWGFLAASAVVLPLVKPNYAILSMLAVLLVFFRTHYRWWWRFAFSLLLLVAVTAPALAWAAAAHTSATATAGLLPAIVGHPDAHKQSQALAHSPQTFFLGALPKMVITGQDAYINSMVGALGWNFVVLPISIVSLLLALMTLAALMSRPGVPVGWSLIFAAIGIVSVTSIFLALYLTFSPVGGSVIYGVQGRYFIPLLPFLMLGLARLVPIGIAMSSRAAALVFSLSTSLALAVAAAYYVIGTY